MTDPSEADYRRKDNTIQQRSSQKKIEPVSTFCFHGTIIIIIVIMMLLFCAELFIVIRRWSAKNQRNIPHMRSFEFNLIKQNQN